MTWRQRLEDALFLTFMIFWTLFLHTYAQEELLSPALDAIDLPLSDNCTLLKLTNDL